MDKREREELAQDIADALAARGADLGADLVERLRDAGVPRGLWLAEIGQVRAALRAADELLLRIQRAIESEAGPGL